MEVPDSVVDAVVDDDEKMLLILLRAEGLGTNDTLPSQPNAPVPNEDINEVVRLLKDVEEEENDGDDDDRFEGETPLPLSPRSLLPSLLLRILDFLDLNNFILRCFVVCHKEARIDNTTMGRCYTQLLA